MSNKQTYQIRIEGHVELDWSSWAETVTVHHTQSGETCMECQLADQTALHGIMMRIRDLGLTLIEVKRIESETDIQEKNQKNKGGSNV